MEAVTKAAAEMKETEGSFSSEFTEETESGIPVLVVLSGGGTENSEIEEALTGVQNLILPSTQSINRLKRVSQLYPRTTAQEESRSVT